MFHTDILEGLAKQDGDAKPPILSIDAEIKHIESPDLKLASSITVNP
jgi:hypothetical protein